MLSEGHAWDFNALFKWGGPSMQPHCNPCRAGESRPHSVASRLSFWSPLLLQVVQGEKCTRVKPPLLGHEVLLNSPLMCSHSRSFLTLCVPWGA